MDKYSSKPGHQSITATDIVAYYESIPDDEYPSLQHDPRGTLSSPFQEQMYPRESGLYDAHASMSRPTTSSSVMSRSLSQQYRSRPQDQTYPHRSSSNHYHHHHTSTTPFSRAPSSIYSTRQSHLPNPNHTSLSHTAAAHSLYSRSPSSAGRNFSSSTGGSTRPLSTQTRADKRFEGSWLRLGTTRVDMKELKKQEREVEKQRREVEREMEKERKKVAKADMKNARKRKD